MAKVVVWGADARGYTVQTCGPEGIEDEYEGGNSPFESQTTLHPDNPQALPESKMREWAEQTARETVAELLDNGEGPAIYGGEDEDVTQARRDLAKAIEEGRL